MNKRAAGRGMVVALLAVLGAVRVDAQAVSLLTRPAWAQVPAGVRVLKIKVRRLGAPVGGPVTVAAPARVRRIVREVNRLPVWQMANVPVACPADVGPLVQVAFFRRRGDAVPAAVATADGSGCGTVALEVHGRTAPSLTGGPAVIAALESAAPRLRGLIQTS